MKTRKFCPHCGRPVVRSRTPGYAFQCHACDEDFYRFEVLNTRQIPLVRELRRIERERRFNPRRRKIEGYLQGGIDIYDNYLRGEAIATKAISHIPSSVRNVRGVRNRMIGPNGNMPVPLGARSFTVFSKRGYAIRTPLGSCRPKGTLLRTDHSDPVCQPPPNAL